MSFDVSSIFNSAAASDTMDQSGKVLDKALSKDMTNAKDEELMEVCKQFESYFIEQMFKEMKKTVPESSEMSGPTKNLQNYFQDSLYQEYAKDAADQQGYGLAQSLFEQMKRNTEAEEV